MSNSADLAVLAGINFHSFDPEDILSVATAGAASLCACRVEASYCGIDGGMQLCPPSQTEQPELVRRLQESNWDGRVELPSGGWGWAFPLCHGDDVQGCMVIGAQAEPAADHFFLLQLLAQKAGAALACAALHQREARRSSQLAEANEILSGAVHRLQARTNAHELLEAAMSAGEGQQGIADALHRVTRRPVCIEDKFGNLCAWAGPGQPLPYPKPKAGQRDRFLRSFSPQGGALRIDDRVCVPIRPHAEILGVVALIDPDDDCDEDVLFTLRYCSNLLGLELSHQRNLAELQLNLQRDLVDDLVAGTNEDGAYARAEALGHDLRRPHHVVVIQTGRVDHADMVAAGRAAAKLNLKYLAGRQGPLVVVLFDGRPAADALHLEVSRQLGKVACAIGIGSRCEVPADFPQSYVRARRALNVRLNSSTPHGASDYFELGFYHLVDAAHAAGVVDDYLRQWLGVLTDYDAVKKSDLVHTLSYYVECGGNYDESAAALHIHRSTLRYRLGRIADLTGFDLRDVDTRFNLHAATRVWRFLSPNT